VSFFRELSPLTPDEEAERREALYYNILQGLWTDFHLTGDLDILATIMSVGPEREVWGQSGQAQELWKEFVRTGDRLKLADFIIAGGEIDKYERRKTIAEVVAAKPDTNPGGSKDAINIAFYIEVEVRRLQLTPESSGEEVEKLTLQESLASLKKTTKEAAIWEVAHEGATRGRGVGYEGGRTRYNKGKKLFLEKYGKEWN
jgi:hypothetical protein